MTLAEEREIRIAYPYFAHTEPQAFSVEGSYADREAKVAATTEYGWAHPIAEIVTAVAGAGLRIEFLHEFDWVDYEVVPMLDRGGDGKWRLHEGIEGELPLMYSLRARKDR